MGNKKIKALHNKVFETDAEPRRNQCPNSRRFLAGPACNLFSNRSTRFNFYDTDHAKSTTGWTSRQNHASWAGTVWVCVANSAFTIQIAINQPQIEYCAEIVHYSQFLLWGHETQFKFYDMNRNDSTISWMMCWNCGFLWKYDIRFNFCDTNYIKSTVGWMPCWNYTCLTKMWIEPVFYDMNCNDSTVGWTLWWGHIFLVRKRLRALGQFNYYAINQHGSTAGWIVWKNHASWAGTVWVCVVNSIFTIQTTINQS